MQQWTDEDRQPLEQDLVGGAEQVVRPLDRGPHRAVPVGAGSPAVLGVAAWLGLVVGKPLETAASRTTADGASIIMWLTMLFFEIATGV